MIINRIGVKVLNKKFVLLLVLSFGFKVKIINFFCDLLFFLIVVSGNVEILVKFYNVL